MELEIVEEVAQITEQSEATKQLIEASIHMLDNIVTRLNNWMVFWAVLEISAFALSIGVLCIAVVRAYRNSQHGRHNK